MERKNKEGKRGDAVNSTHSRTRWTRRTFIPFQAVSPLQRKIKRRHQKTNTSVVEAHILSYNGLPIVKLAQHEVKRLL